MGIFNYLWTTFWGKILMTFLISMVPVIELRGALPIAEGAGLDFFIALPVAVMGNLLPIPFIIIFIKRIFAFIRKRMPKLNKLVDKLEHKAESKRATVEKYTFWGLFLFVAIPLPGTGAWTGALIAAMMDMPLKKAFPSIVLGVLGAALIVTLVTQGAFAIFS